MTTLILIGLKGSLLLAAALAVSRSNTLSASVKHLVLVLAMLSAPLLVVLEQIHPPSFTFEHPALNLALPYSAEDAAASPGVWREPGGFADVLPYLTFGHGYALVCAIFLVYWCLQVYLSLRWVARAPVLQTAVAVPALHRTVTFRQASHDGSPATWGLLRPAIVVPADWDTWSERKRTAAVIHELAHIRRLDVLTGLLATFIACVFWANPLVWMARRRLLEEAEQACDDAVIARGVPPASYASDLLEITRSRSPRAAAAMARRSTLFRRIHALLDNRTRRAPMTPGTASAAVVLTLTLVSVLGAVGASSTSALAAQRLVENMSGDVYQRLSAARDLITAGQLQAALQTLDELRARPQALNDNELAQIHNLRGFVHFRLEDYAQAMDEYEAVVTNPDAIPEGLETQTLYTLAQLAYVTERYPEAVDYITAWMELVDNPGPDPYVFIGQVQLQMRNYPAALASVRKGIRTAADRGAEVKDHWRKLEAYLQSVIDNGGDAAADALAGRGTDGEYLPIVKVAPIYPLHAQRQKIEGYVELEFTVTTTGAVADPVIIDSHPPGVFDRAAIDAVNRFKYKPRVRDGIPVEVTGVRNRIAFELEE